MKLKNTGRNAIGIRYSVTVKPKKTGEPMDYKDHLVVADPGQEVEIPDDIGQILIQKVERPKGRHAMLTSVAKGETAVSPRSRPAARGM